MGILLFLIKNTDGFIAGDQRLLTIIGSQSAQLLERSRLYKEEQELLLIKEEMNVAKRIQNNLLPEKSPYLKGYWFPGTNSSAKEIGGDYFDFISISDTKFGFCIADITGKGMPAALLMSNLQALLRSQVQIERDLSKAIAAVNNLLFQSTDSTKFATLFYGVLDIENHTIIYCNAGHDEGLVFRNGVHSSSLASTGLILGIMPDMEYEIGEISLNPGDSLVCYTDGVTEAMNVKEEEFGIEKTIEVIEAIEGHTALKIEKGIIKAIREHSEGTSQSDDITIVVIHREK